MSTDLSKAMRKLAATGTMTDELNSLADAFDAAADGFYGKPQTVDVKTFMGHWVQARKAYAKAVGGDVMVPLPNERART